MAVKFIPDDYHSVTPYLMTKGAADAIEFYKRAFGAEELFKMDMPGGKIGHAEIRIGDSRLMLADDCGGETRSVVHNQAARQLVFMCTWKT